MARSPARPARLALRAALLESTSEEAARVRITVASGPLTVRLVARCAGQIARSNHSAHEISVMKVAANVPNHTAFLTLLWDGAARLTWALHGASSPGMVLNTPLGQW
jgi:hypothetical protein